MLDHFKLLDCIICDGKDPIWRSTNLAQLFIGTHSQMCLRRWLIPDRNSLLSHDLVSPPVWGKTTPNLHEIYIETFKSYLITVEPQLSGPYLPRSSVNRTTGISGLTALLE